MLRTYFMPFALKFLRLDLFILPVLFSKDEILCCQLSPCGWERLWTPEPLPTPILASEGWDCRYSASSTSIRLETAFWDHPSSCLWPSHSLHWSILPPFSPSSHLPASSLSGLNLNTSMVSHYCTASSFSFLNKSLLFLILSCFLLPRGSGWIQGTKT